MCEHCEANKKEGNKFCTACGVQVNETMKNESGCQHCKCAFECNNKCAIRRKVFTGRQSMPFKCGRRLEKENYCPNCNKKTFIYINRIES
jgi:hypothetical protein